MTSGSASPSSSKNTADSAGSQCWPVCTTTSSIPASRSATESGADLMNCGRFPTTVSSLIGVVSCVAWLRLVTP